MRGHVVRILLLIAATICTVACHVDCVSRRADGSTSGTTCHTALQTQHRQTVTVLRTVGSPHRTANRADLAGGWHGRTS
jgi:hypothetical protein